MDFFWNMDYVIYFYVYKKSKKRLFICFIKYKINSFVSKILFTLSLKSVNFGKLKCLITFSSKILSSNIIGKESRTTLIYSVFVKSQLYLLKDKFNIYNISKVKTKSKKKFNESLVHIIKVEKFKEENKLNTFSFKNRNPMAEEENVSCSCYCSIW